MNPDTQRLKIAEACPSLAHRNEEGEWMRRSAYNTRFDPLHDLNAMHEAVKAIAATHGTDFCMELRKIVVRDCQDNPLCQTCDGLVGDVYFYNATAAQRAEAFLKATGLWE